MARLLRRAIVLVAFLATILAVVVATLRPSDGESARRSPGKRPARVMESRATQARECDPELSPEPIPILTAGPSGAESAPGLEIALLVSLPKPCELLEFLKTLERDGQNSASTIAPSSCERIAALLEEDHWQCEEAMSVLFQPCGIAARVLEVVPVRIGMNVLRRWVLDSASRSKYGWLGSVFGELAGANPEYRCEILSLIRDPSIPLDLRVSFWQGMCEHPDRSDDVGRTGLWLMEQELGDEVYESVAISMANIMEDREVAQEVAESAVWTICERHLRARCPPVGPDQGRFAACAHMSAFHRIANAGGDAMRDVLNGIPRRAGVSWSTPGSPTPVRLSTRVSGQWSAARLSEVVHTLSQKCRVDIFVDKGIDEYVTGTFEDGPAGEILDAILEHIDCTVTEYSPTLFLITRRVDSTPPQPDPR